jgi:hypothetical protein
MKKGITNPARTKLASIASRMKTNPQKKKVLSCMQ